MSDLFRQEVIDRQTSRHLGDVILAPPRSLIASTLIVIALAIGSICATNFGTYAHFEKSEGMIFFSDDDQDLNTVFSIPLTASKYINVGDTVKLNVRNGDPIYLSGIDGMVREISNRPIVIISNKMNALITIDFAVGDQIDRKSLSGLTISGELYIGRRKILDRIIGAELDVSK